MKITEYLDKLLETAEPNILGNRYASVESNGIKYSVTVSSAGSHTSAAHWARKDYRVDGKRVAKAALEVTEWELAELEELVAQA